MRKRKAILATVMILAGLCTAASASRVVHMTAVQMAESSALVVAGRVTGVESFWNEKRTKIFTRTTVMVDETFKGAPAPTVELIQLGGTVGNIRVTVDGALLWAPGEEVLLFLEPYDTGRYQVSGMSQGKFAIERDPETGEKYVCRAALEGVELLRPDGSPAPADGRVGRVRLDQFITEVMKE